MNNNNVNPGKQASSNSNLNKSASVGNQTSEVQDQGIMHKIGDAIEQVGKKISAAGAPKVGDAIKAAGDKIEHARDSKNH